ncbi:DUF5610 domain-containing protein [Neptunicella sp. SCSIO 80796]|uniref:DUF5610 domain-containing protein n=1 Tax=Neptunicella plasticusilytica TaxID=3117012 RepID=UPI003A4D442D
MNIGDLKAFLGNKTHLSERASHSNDAARFDNHRQAIGKQGNHVSLLSSGMFSLSSQSFIGARVYNHSLNQNLIINEQKANLPSPKKEQDKGLFDFEEVAKNVLTFVGGALKNAKSRGMSEDQLTSMFEQARSGVLKGVNMAKRDLGEMMNGEISDGIKKSQDLIEEGIKSLEQQLFGKQRENASATNSVAINSSITHTEQESGQLTIRTRDGDEVSISFEDARQFSLNQQILIESQQRQAEREAEQEKDKGSIDPVADPAPATNAASTPAAQQSETTAPDATNNETSSVPADEDTTANANQQASEAGTGQQDVKVSSETSYLHFESSKLSYSVKGELDEEELRAIGDLVGDAGKLADEFFYGDIDKAFNQALELGYDDQELTGFALQLTSYKQTEVIKTYEAVSHYNEQSEGNVGDSVKAVRPVADYLEHMLDVVDKAQNLLEDGNAYDNLVNGLINTMPEVHTPDLIEAINRFRGFNQLLMDNLPQRQS